MADKKALPPGENQGAPDETLEVTAPVPAGGGAVAKSPDETQSTVLQDPTRRRDTNTASLKRLRPEDFNAASDDGDDSDNTETVNIKVIKEQKKQFRNMMTSSQTLAVDADGAPAESAAPAATQQPSSKSTLKIKAPQAETRTESIPRPTPTSAPTQPASPSPKSTLKIKAPPGVAPAQGAAKPGATLKIKAPAAAPAGQASPAAQTVKQAAPGRPGKTIKLTQQPPSRQPARRTSAAEQYSVAPEVSASPGITYTVFSVGGVAACAVILFKVFTSMNELFGSLNIFEKTLY
jgi:hypothetical protein